MVLGRYGRRLRAPKRVEVLLRWNDQSIDRTNRVKIWDAGVAVPVGAEILINRVQQ